MDESGVDEPLDGQLVVFGPHESSMIIWAKIRIYDGWEAVRYTFMRDFSVGCYTFMRDFLL